MINMDMIGRLSDTLTVGGYGTSPLWAPVWNGIRDKKYISIRNINTVATAGDQFAFYLASIPVLIFTTGIPADDHRPGDDADKINYPGELQVLKFIYSVIEGANARGRITFTPAEGQPITSLP